MYRIIIALLLYLGLWGASPNARSQDASDGLILPLGMVEVNLPEGWVPLFQPTNFFVQQRARNVETGIAISAGTFNAGLTLEEYVALDTAAMGGPDNVISKGAKILKMPESEVERIVTSRAGAKLVEQMKTANAELISATELEILGYKAFETRSKITIPSGQIVFSRQYIMRGKYPKDIITVALGAADESVFADETVLACIKRAQRRAVAPVAPVSSAANPALSNVPSVDQASANYLATIDQLSKEVPEVQTSDQAAKVFKTFTEANNSLAAAVETFTRNNPNKNDAPEYVTANSTLGQVATKYPTLLSDVAKLVHKLNTDQQAIAIGGAFEKSLYRVGNAQRPSKFAP